MSAVGFLSGLTVHAVRVGSGLWLIVSDAQRLDENTAEILIEAPCLVIDPAGTKHRVERASLETLPALLALPSQTITEASADGGTLRATFDGGRTLAVPPLDQYEAWEIRGPGDQGIICLPGGELAVWK